MYGNRSVELRKADSGQQSADECQILCCDECGFLLQRIDCAMRSADGGAIHASTSIGFDSGVESIAGGWMPSEAGDRLRAVVACELNGRSHPAIMHFYPANE